jgi:small-conductance mechanosensitive channel
VLVLIRLVAVALGTAVGVALVTLLHRALLRLGRRTPLVGDLARRAHRPVQLLVAMAIVDLGLRASGLSGRWREPVTHTVDLVLIGSAAWLVAMLMFVVEDAALARFRTDVRDNQYARTVHTQIRLLRRVTVVVVAIVALGAMLMTFQEARLVGTSVLASAGVAAAVAAFAAQALLGNLFAGLQIAFGKALRLDDVVVVEGEWGRVEEITLTHVVLHIWDDRRLILPTSYFTTHPFENWTRSGASLLGSVELEVDWSVPVDALRDELRRVVSGSPMWDGRVGVLQVTDAVGGLVRLRALVSAPDAPTLWDLRCLVRERLVGALRERYPSALPRVRAEVGAELRPRPRPRTGDDGRGRAERPPADGRVFGGDPARRRRAHAFSGPPPAVADLEWP